MAICLFAIMAHSQNEEADTVNQTTTATLEDDEYEDEDESPTYYGDTLRQNFRSIVYDSIEAINTDKGFYYKRYLDSLLRATAKPKPKRQIDLGGGGFFSSFGIILWVLAIALFGFLVYKLFLSNSSLFSKNRKNLSSDIEVSLQEDTGDPDALLRNAIRSGNYRLAVRYLYLQALNKLAERKLIEMNSNKTNYEYVNEIRKHRFANEFASLTLQYEYVWYGEYPVDETLFDQIQNSFSQFNKNVIR